MFRIILSVALLLGLLVTGCGKKNADLEEEFFEKPAEEKSVQQEILTPVESEQTVRMPEEKKPAKKLVFETVYFAFDAYELTPETREVLAGHVKKLRENPAVNLLIEGHCDERGTVEYNLALGDKRAHTVKTYMANFGIDGKRLSIISYGKERPVDTGHWETAWAKNRRAVFVILK